MRTPVLTRPRGATTPLRLPPATDRMGDVGLSRSERARRILALLLRSEGPVLLVVRGTDNGAFDNGARDAVQRVLARHRGPIALASIPYPATFPPWPGSAPDGEAVLELVLDGLRRHAPRRPVWVIGESQGAWVVANVLSRPHYAAMVHRAALLALPALIHPFLGAASVVEGAARVLPSSRMVTFAHTDDVIASTPPQLGNLLAPAFWAMLGGLAAGQGFSYAPHDYRGEGQAVARWIVDGIAPDARGAMHPRANHEGLA